MSKLICLFLFLTVHAQRNNNTNSRKTLRTLQYRGEVLESLYNVYDPSYLALVWLTIRNGVHLAVNSACFGDMKVFLNDFNRGRAWTYIAVDASGRYNSGAHSGRRHWLGSRQQCLDLDKNKSIREDTNNMQNDIYLNEMLRKEFRQGQEKSTMELEKMHRAREPPIHLAYSIVTVQLNITRVTMAKSLEILQGVCLPQSCSPEDIKTIVEFTLMVTDNLKLNKTSPRTVKVKSSRRVETFYDITNDYEALSLISITMFLLVLCIIATLVDYNLLKCERKIATQSFNVQKYNNDLNEFERKSNLVDETLTINNIENSNINLVTVKKVIKHNAVPPSITLDVVSLENATNSCKRCGKYKKQCVNPLRSDHFQPCPRVKYDNSYSLKAKRSVYQYLLLCFSLNYGWRRIFNTNMANKDLSIMHAIRILTTFWVVFIHVAMMVSYLSDDVTDMDNRSSVFMILATGSLAFDTLFFVSGLFSSYHFFYLKSQYSVEELVSFGGTCGQVLQLFCFITNRAVRLLPSYAYAIFLASVLARATRRTSVLELPGQDDHCDATWWRNILYITNVYPPDERCMQVSWYLTMETQLHAAGAVVCAVASRRRAALTLGSIAVVTATAADVVSAVGDYGKPMADAFAAYRVMLERPWARAAPYLTGVFAGWLVRRTAPQLKVSRLTAGLLWLASLAALGVAAAVPRLSPAWVSCFLRLVLPVALLWPALVCATNFAGLSRQLMDSGSLAALSRLCYSVLILHGPITRTVLLSLDGALCSNTLCIWSYFAGSTLLTLLASLLLSLLVEMPCCSLLRRLSDCANS